MNIHIGGLPFPEDIGKRLLKTKYGECRFPELREEWDDIEPIGFFEIVSEISDIDLRGIAIRCIGMEGILKDIEPVLLASETLMKRTVWVEKDGSLIDREYEDTYELYKVKWSDLFFQKEDRHPDMEDRIDRYFVKFKDTTTRKDYLIWVDIDAIASGSCISPRVDLTKPIDMAVIRARLNVNPIQAIAWTIRTDIPLGGVKAIVRQGDCVLLKPDPDCERLPEPRPLTESEYRKLMYCES